MLHELIALVALTAMEIVLGIDNVVFISVTSAKLPPEQRKRAQQVGLLVAAGMRILLLLTISWIIGLTTPIFSFSQFGFPVEWNEWLTGHKEFNEFSWRDLILLVGGLFLIRSAVLEIHHKVEGQHDVIEESKRPTFAGVIAQIAVLDLIFSLDSVLTAVGMAESIWVMITSVILAIIVMMIFASSVSAFVEKHPTVKMLALSFLLLIGVMLVAEGIGTHIEKCYIYFAMGFSLLVEGLNLWSKRNARLRAERTKMAKEATV
jgi:predicted tellurium resistance membrane protein TerC